MIQVNGQNCQVFRYVGEQKWQSNYSGRIKLTPGDWWLELGTDYYIRIKKAGEKELQYRPSQGTVLIGKNFRGLSPLTESLFYFSDAITFGYPLGSNKLNMLSIAILPNQVMFNHHTLNVYYTRWYVTSTLVYNTTDYDDTIAGQHIRYNFRSTSPINLTSKFFRLVDSELHGKLMAAWVIRNLNK